MKKYVEINLFVKLFCQPKKIIYTRVNMLELIIHQRYQYMKSKSDKLLYIIYADIESLIKKMVKVIEKNLQEQKQENKLIADIQYQQYGHLIIQRINILYHGEDCMKKFANL